MKEKLKPEESLALIAEVISQTKENYKQHSFIFLFWGWLIAVASFGKFILETQTEFKYNFLPFPIVVFIGLVVSVFYYKKQQNASTDSHLNFFIRNLWMVLALAFIMIIFVSLVQKIPPFPYTLIIAAVGTILSGQVLKVKALLFGGICFLIASVFCVFISSEYMALVHGIAIVIGYIIPGYILKNPVLKINGIKF